MPKHRGNVFTVVRERVEECGNVLEAVIGTYWSLVRAEEVAAGAAQRFKDMGIPEDAFEFNVKINTYYDE